MRLPDLQYDSDTQNILDYIKNKNYWYFVDGKIKDHQITNLIEKLKNKLKNKNRKGEKHIQQDENIKSKLDVPKYDNFMDPYTKNTNQLYNDNHYKNTQLSENKNLQNQFLNQNEKQNNGYKNEIKNDYNDSYQKYQDNESNKSVEKIQESPKQQQFKENEQEIKKQEQQEGGFEEIELEDDDDEDNDYEKQNENKSKQQRQNLYDDIEIDDYDDFYDSNDKNHNQEGEYRQVLKKKSSDSINYDTYDLNKLEGKELQKHKDKMEQNFESPSHPNYVYDKRKSFDMNELQDNDWDDDN